MNIVDDPVPLEEVTELVQPGIGIFMSSLATTIEMLVPNEPRDIVEWAAEYLIVPTEVSERSGPLEMPRFQASIVRLSQLPTTRQISHQKPTRIGSSFMSAVEILYYVAWEDRILPARLHEGIEMGATAVLADDRILICNKGRVVTCFAVGMIRPKPKFGVPR